MGLGLVLAFFSRLGWLNLEVLRLPWLCPLKALTGHPCPGCGLTDAIRAFLQGHFWVAAKLNPNVYPLALWLVLKAFWPESWALNRKKLPRGCIYTVWLVLALVWWLVRW